MSMSISIDRERTRRCSRTNRSSRLLPGEYGHFGPALTRGALAISLLGADVDPRSVAASDPRWRQEWQIGAYRMQTEREKMLAGELYVPLDAELRRKQEFGKPVEIGSDVWVGGGAIICPGVRIGSRC